MYVNTHNNIMAQNRQEKKEAIFYYKIMENFYIMVYNLRMNSGYRQLSDKNERVVGDMNKKKLLAAGLALTFLLSSGFTGKEPVESVMYTKEAAEVYDSREEDANYIGIIPGFEEVAVIKHDGNNFSKIYFEGQKGYVKGNVLSDYESVVPLAVEAQSAKLMLPMLYVRPETPSNVIFIGDSRTGQMFQVVKDYPNNDTWIAQAGEGYKWFSEIATPMLEGIAQEGDKIVVQMGINDLFSHTAMEAAVQYMIFANTELMDWIDGGAEVYVVSINPVEKHKSINNEQIEFFNLLMSTCLADEVHYIDTYSELQAGRYPTVDGIHYSNEVYEKIYQYIMNQIDPMNAVPVDFNDYPDWLFPKAPEAEEPVSGNENAERTEGMKVIDEQ